MLKKTILMLVLFLMLVFMSACGNNTGKQASINTETPVKTLTETPKPELPSDSSEGALFNSEFLAPDTALRPVAVMIDNQGDKVLPQGGISQAQIVYEMLVEGNITRYLAFFWGTLPEMIGPVRSSRHYFLDYAMEYDAIYTHFGWSEYAKADIKKLKIQNINGLVNGDAFWDITKDRGNWQDSFTSKERIEKQISVLKYRTEPKKAFPFQYNDKLVIPEKGEKAVDIFIKFDSIGNSCGFLYDSETNVYDRIRMEKPQMERNTGKQVMATNIIIQEVASPLIANDREGRRNLKNIGSGDGLFITGGKVVSIIWSKNARDAQTTYTTVDGKPIILNRGQTCIEIVPTLNSAKIQ